MEPAANGPAVTDQGACVECRDDTQVGGRVHWANIKLAGQKVNDPLADFRWKLRPGGYGMDNEPGKQLVVQPDPDGDSSGTHLECDDLRREQCLFWRDPARAPSLNK